jgi:hypothetical protein
LATSGRLRDWSALSRRWSVRLVGLRE